MVPVELELKNFLAYRDPLPLSFDGIQVACLAGANGAGKSSLLDAITWVLWGKARMNAADELIYQGQSDMRVSLVFDQAGLRFKVVRQRKSGKRSLLEFQGWDQATESWKTLSEATMRATQYRIDALLRLDYETFVNSSFLIQGKADAFTRKTPNQRKQILSNILGLAVWEDYENKAKKEIRIGQSEIQRLDGRIEEIEREVSKEDKHKKELAESESAADYAAKILAEAENAWAGLENARNQLVFHQRQVDDLSERIRNIEINLREAQEEIGELRVRADKETIQKNLDQVRSQLKQLEPIQAKHLDITDQVAQLRQTAAHLRGINTALGPETKPVKARLETLEGATEPRCPTCGQPLSEEHRHKLLEELQAEVEGKRGQFRRNRDQLNEFELKIARLSEEVAELDKSLSKRVEFEKKIGELELSLTYAEEASEKAIELERKSARWKVDLEKERKKRDEEEALAEQSEVQLRAATLQKDDLQKLRLEKRMADERVGGGRQKLAAIMSLREQRRRHVDERSKLADDNGLLEDLRQAFGKNGLPAMIIETVVPELERSANELLARMTEGRMAVRFNTLREIKSGHMREALDIIISDELGTRPYDTYSGGESFRINFAIRIAISKLLARRAGAQLRSLFIDEGFGSQDAQGREQLVSAINSIQDDFDLILVITHLEEMKDAFPARIEVSKTATGSQFRLS